jgi:hypothetical protein
MSKRPTLDPLMLLKGVLRRARADKETLNHQYPMIFFA